MGKGDRYRYVDGKVWDRNYDRIFGDKRIFRKCPKCGGSGKIMYDHYYTDCPECKQEVKCDTK